MGHTPSSSRRPYLIRAMHEWMVDNNQTPHVVVDANVDGVAVPPEFIKDDKVILNVSYEATEDLVLGGEQIEFRARFGGRPMAISLPVRAVLGIYARETGQGMLFPEENMEPEPEPGGGEKKAAKPGGHLKVVK